MFASLSHKLLSPKYLLPAWYCFSLFRLHEETNDFWAGAGCHVFGCDTLSLRELSVIRSSGCRHNSCHQSAHCGHQCKCLDVQPCYFPYEHTAIRHSHLYRRLTVTWRPGLYQWDALQLDGCTCVDQCTGLNVSVCLHTLVCLSRS